MFQSQYDLNLVQCYSMMIMSIMICRSQCERGTAGTAFYAVSRGRNPGVYYSWSDCQSQVKGFQNPLYKKFTTEVEAKEFCAKSSRSKSTGLILICQQLVALNISVVIRQLFLYVALN